MLLSNRKRDRKYRVLTGEDILEASEQSVAPITLTGLVLRHVHGILDVHFLRYPGLHVLYTLLLTVDAV